MANDELERRRAWAEDGFFIVHRWVRPKRLIEVSEACDHVLQHVRSASRAQGHLTTHVSGLLAP